MIPKDEKKRAGLAGYIALVFIFLCGALVGGFQSIVAAVKPLVCGG